MPYRASANEKIVAEWNQTKTPKFKELLSVVAQLPGSTRPIEIA